MGEFSRRIFIKGTQYAGGESLKDIPVYGAIAYVAG